MSDISVEDITKSTLSVMDWGIPKILASIRKLQDKDRIELILNKIIENNYIISQEIRELMKDDYGYYESSWGRVLKTLESYPLKCELVIKQAIKRKWIKFNPKAKCKVRIRKIDKIDDARWGFTTIKKKLPDNLEHSNIIIDGKKVELFADPTCPKNEFWIHLETLESGEELFGVWSFNI